VGTQKVQIKQRLCCLPDKQVPSNAVLERCAGPGDMRNNVNLKSNVKQHNLEMSRRTMRSMQSKPVKCSNDRETVCNLHLRPNDERSNLCALPSNLIQVPGGISDLLLCLVSLDATFLTVGDLRYQPEGPAIRFQVHNHIIAKLTLKLSEEQRSTTSNIYFGPPPSRKTC
jgi:hypothetical protein